MALASFAGLGRTERRIRQDAVLRVHLLVHQHRGLQGLRAKLPDEASKLSRRHATGTRSLDCHRHAVRVSAVAGRNPSSASLRIGDPSHELDSYDPKAPAITLSTPGTF